jgi:hypothetical protein
VPAIVERGIPRAQLDRSSSVFSAPEFHFLSPAVQDMWRRHNPTTRPDLDRFERRERSKYPFVQKLTLALSHAKVPLLVGSDASAPGLFPGQSVHTELQELVKAGLRPEDALVAATRTPGDFIGRHTRTVPFGTISRGSRADMILFRRNPVEHLANLDSLAGVMVRGRWFMTDDLKRLRTGAAR